MVEATQEVPQVETSPSTAAEEQINTQPSPEIKTEAKTEEAKQAPARPEYTGDKGEIEYNFVRDTPIEKKPVATFAYGERVRIASLHDNYEKFIDHIIQVAGWARTTRLGGKDFAFIELTDGSGASSLQVVIDSTMPDFENIAAQRVGASFKIKGKLIKSPAAGQEFELQVCQPDTHAVKVIGTCPGNDYPLSKKRHTVEFLRDIAHLRPRTKLISAVTRVRNNLAYATHKFFQERGFLYIHTPIITASDCEGAGEMFQVTTTLPNPSEPISKAKLYEYVGEENEEEEKKDEPKKKKAKKDKKKKAEGEEEKEEEAPKEPEKEIIPVDQRKVNYKKDFFGKPAFLTVSG